MPTLAIGCDKNDSQKAVKTLSQLGQRMIASSSADYYISGSWYDMTYKTQEQIVFLIWESEICLNPKLNRVDIHVGNDKVAQYTYYGPKIIKHRP